MSGQVVKVVEANVQGLVDQRKRTQCFLRWTRGKTASDLVLLTETGCRTAAMEISWAREVTAVSSVYGACFAGQAVMLWRRSAIMPDDPTDVGAIASTMPVAI